MAVLLKHICISVSFSLIPDFTMTSPFCYKNSEYEKPGIALIFNHEKFKDSANERKGTGIDKNRLINGLKKFGFETRPYDNLTYSELTEKLEDVSKENHKDNGCLIVIVMTHGDQNRLKAYDNSYYSDELFEPFYGDNCESLINKPKLFFIQACRGSEKDVGVLKSEQFDDSNNIDHRIPTTSDFFIMFSTCWNYVSVRNEWTGSWFIESLYKELELVEDRVELTHLATNISYRVAEKWSVNKKTKQQPVSCSTLRKLYYFIKIK